MSRQMPKVDEAFTSVRDLILTNNKHVILLGTAAPSLLRKGTDVVVTAVEADHFVLNCKDGHGNTASSWGLKIKVAKLIWGMTFAPKD